MSLRPRIALHLESVRIRDTADFNDWTISIVAAAVALGVWMVSSAILGP